MRNTKTYRTSLDNGMPIENVIQFGNWIDGAAIDQWKDLGHLTVIEAKLVWMEGADENEFDELLLQIQFLREDIVEDYKMDSDVLVEACDWLAANVKAMRG